jgi:large subunit ribosomal protein L22
VESNLIRASHRHARITARKARLSVDMVRGLPVNRALEVLEFTHRRGARLVEKVIKSALANAQQDENIDVNSLVIAEARVDDGPLLGGRPRWRPASRGRAAPIRKRTSHILIGLGAAPGSVLRELPSAAEPAAAKPAKRGAKAPAADAAQEAKPKKPAAPKSSGKGPKSGGSSGKDQG